MKTENVIYAATSDSLEREKMPKQIVLQQYLGIDGLIMQIQRCEKGEHKQQVAYSTYENAFTQVCFTCETVRTNVEID